MNGDEDISGINDGDLDDNVDQELIEEAKKMGWQDEESFKGDKSKWTSAEEFVEKGRHVLPILAENNKRMQKELLTRDTEIGNLRKAVENSDKAISAMEKHFNAATQARVKEAKQTLINEIKSARELGDVDAEMLLLEQLDDVKSEEKAATAASKEEKPAEKPAESYMTPTVKAWGAENSWYGQDKRKSKILDRACEDLRDAGETSVDVEFLEKAKAVMEERMEFMEAFEAQRSGKKREVPANKVVSGGPNRANSGGGGKGFADLPREAQKACHEDNDTFVGEGKRYKTQKEWETAYTKLYIGEE